MTVTPKVDPRKDRGPQGRPASTATTYALWALVAVVAIGTAGSVFVWRDGKAPMVAQAPIAAVPPAPVITVNQKSEREISRLNEAVRVLASERDRLANRLDQLERSVGDITATIPQNRPAPVDQEPPPPSAPPVQVVTPPNPQSRPTPGPNQIMPPQQPAQTPVPPLAAAPPPGPSTPSAAAPDIPAATKTEFAIDLGGEKTVDGLRARWATLRGNHGGTLEGLRPLISVKEGAKAGTVELRLVAGPVANAQTAARVCAKLQTSGVPCAPTVFDGQRLSLR